MTIEACTQGDTYRTPPLRRSALARLSPSLAFYKRFVNTLFRAANQARRGTYDDRRWTVSSHVIRRALEASGVPIAVEGLDHVRHLTGPAVFVGNHMSILETLVLPSLIRPIRPVTFVVKQSLVEYPVFRFVLTSRNPVVVTRTNPRADFETVMTEGKDRLKSGISLVIFPQTTRTPIFDSQQFNSIGVKLARRARVPVIPIALRSDAWGYSKYLGKDLGPIDPAKKVNFAFGAPIQVKGRGDDAQEQCIAFIESHLEEWGLPPVRHPAA